MNAKITMDGAGRVVIPKPVRDRLHLQPGDSLELDAEGEHITLRPVRPQATLKKEYGIWVYQGGSADLSIPDLITREREKRFRELEA
jgi:AbrB family looped-hinge helix DNA binding protein